MGLNGSFTIPILNFQGTATGIDLRKVVRTGILLIIDTAVAHRKPGIGYIGFQGTSAQPMIRNLSKAK